jgi:hypothetical protein
MNKIPTHDPQTGDLNPYYEELTGQPNPLAPKNEVPSTFDLNQLVGKKFRYISSYGLSTWTDIAIAITMKHGIHTNFNKACKEHVPLEVVGYTYDLQVVASETGYLYEFNKCVFLDND